MYIRRVFAKTDTSWPSLWTFFFRQKDPQMQCVHLSSVTGLSLPGARVHRMSEFLENDLNALNITAEPGSTSWGGTRRPT